MEIENKLRECFKTAERNEKEGIKHKGLLARSPNQEEAEGYIDKSKRELELCRLYKEKGFDYKLPEEWFYILYYCAIAILAKFGVESRSQKWTALFLEYVKEKGIIDYDNEFIERITVHIKKGEESDVDKREEARYSHLIKIESVEKEYDETTQLCKKAISQAEEIVFSKEELKTSEILSELGISDSAQNS
jgi:hypothetical protein